MSPRILVFGTGSVGAVYAYLLSRAVPESDIVTVCRSNYDEAARDGFRIHSTIWGDDLVFRPVVVRSVDEAVEALGPGDVSFDYVLVCPKALPSTPSTAELIRPAVSEGTAIVLLQNGVGIEDDFARLYYPAHPILSTVVYLPATQVQPAVVQHREIELLHVGTFPAAATVPTPHRAAAQAFVDLVKSAGGTARLHDDVQRERWVKLLVNGAWNPVCALTRLRDRSFIDAHPDAVQFVRDVQAEVCAVAQACGHDNVNAAQAEYQLGRSLQRPLPGVQPSMMADALAGRRLEVDAIVGNVVRRAQKEGVEVPLLRTIYMLASGLDHSFTLARPS